MKQGNRPEISPRVRWTMPEPRPRVVTLCCSMRYALLMLRVAGERTAAGEIVLAPFVVVSPEDQRSGAADDLKARLDRVHLSKISLSDAVIVVSDQSGYYGASVRAEIAYAQSCDVPVSFRRVCPDGAAADRVQGCDHGVPAGEGCASCGAVVDSSTAGGGDR